MLSSVCVCVLIHFRRIAASHLYIIHFSQRIDRIRFPRSAFSDPIFARCSASKKLGRDITRREEKVLRAKPSSRLYFASAELCTEAINRTRSLADDDGSCLRISRDGNNYSVIEIRARIVEPIGFTFFLSFSCRAEIRPCQ